MENFKKTFSSSYQLTSETPNFQGIYFSVFYFSHVLFHYYYHNFLAVIFWARDIVCNWRCQSHLMLINNPNFYVSDVRLKGVQYVAKKNFFSFIFFGFFFFPLEGRWTTIFSFNYIFRRLLRHILIALSIRVEFRTIKYPLIFKYILWSIWPS